ncbi:MAG: helix-turn-helix transcriptional regulator [Bacteroidales bacterium]|nr:helix-turn-helix transcriptional regulator [Bacteroidales bacterium]
MPDEFQFTNETIQASRLAKAFSHPVRLYILKQLSQDKCCYSSDLSTILPIAKSTLSQHLKELRDAGLIHGTIESPKIKYCLNKEVWELARSFFQDVFQLS